MMSEQMLGNFSGFVLTTVRIRQRHSNLLKSALLNEVNAVGVVYRSQFLWLFAAAFIFVSSLAVSVNDPVVGILMFFIALVCVIIYFLTRKVVFVIHAGALEMVEVLNGDVMTEAVAFIDAIEQAKNADCGKNCDENEEPSVVDALASYGDGDEKYRQEVLAALEE